NSIGIVIENAILKNPNFKKNEILENEFEEYLKEVFIDSIADNNSFFSDLKFDLEGVGKYSKSTYTANLSFKDSYNINDSTYHGGNFNVIGLLDEKTAKSLTVGDSYSFKGKFKGFLTDSKNRKYNNSINGSLYTPLVGYSSYDGKIDFGVLIVEL